MHAENAPLFYPDSGLEIRQREYEVKAIGSFSLKSIQMEMRDVEEMSLRISMQREAFDSFQACGGAETPLSVFLLSNYDLNVLLSRNRPNFTVHEDRIGPSRQEWENLFGMYLTNGLASPSVLESYASEFLDWKRPNDTTARNGTSSTSLLTTASQYGISTQNLTSVTHHFTTLLHQQTSLISHFTNQSLEIVFKSLSLKEKQYLTPYYLFVWNTHLNCSVPTSSITVHAEYLIDPSTVKNPQSLTLAEIITHVSLWSVLLALLTLVFLGIIGITMLLCLQESKMPVHKSEESVSYLEEIKQDPAFILFMYFLHIFNFIRDHNPIVSVVYRTRRSRQHEIFGSLSRLFAAGIIFCACMGIVVGVQLVHHLARPSHCERSLDCQKDMCAFSKEQLRSAGVAEDSTQWRALESSFSCSMNQDPMRIGSVEYGAGALYFLKGHLLNVESTSGVAQLPHSARNDSTALFSSAFTSNTYFQQCMRDFCFSPCEYAPAAEDKISTCTADSQFLSTQYRVCEHDATSCPAIQRYLVDMPYTLLLSLITFTVFYPILLLTVYLTEKFVGQHIMTRLPKFITLISCAALLAVLSVLVVIEITLILAFTEGSSRLILGMRILFAIGLLLVIMLVGPALYTALFYCLTFRWRHMSAHLREELFISRNIASSDVESMDEFEITFVLCVDYLDCNGDPVIVEEKITEVKGESNVMTLAEYKSSMEQSKGTQEKKASQEKKVAASSAKTKAVTPSPHKHKTPTTV